MIVTPKDNRRNRLHALAIAGLLVAASVIAGWFYHPLLLLAGLGPFVYWSLRRRCLRRLTVMNQPFPEQWEQILRSHVTFFVALDDAENRKIHRAFACVLHARRWLFRRIAQEPNDT